MAANLSNPITGKKSAPFKKLFDRIADRLGSDNKAREYIPITTGTFYKMRDELELTTETGRRILNAHNRLFKTKMRQVG